MSKQETKLESALRKLHTCGGGAVLSDAEVDAVLDAYNELRNRLVRVEIIATRGEGPDTSPETVLATIAHFVSLTLARVPE
jgi:hypothetical protein